MSKPNVIKDALKLFLITVIAGAMLGGVYHITKEPIAAAEEKSKNEAYQAVLSNASTFEETFTDVTVENLPEGVSIDAAVKGLDASGNVVGYVITSTSSKSYGGDITVVIGYNTEGIITGTQVLTISDTPGLGMKAKESAFKDQYIGKSGTDLTITKSGAQADNEIDAISSATITSNAFNGAVNGASAFLAEGLKGGKS